MIGVLGSVGHRRSSEGRTTTRPRRVITIETQGIMTLDDGMPRAVLRVLDGYVLASLPEREQARRFDHFGAYVAALARGQHVQVVVLSHPVDAGTAVDRIFAPVRPVTPQLTDFARCWRAWWDRTLRGRHVADLVFLLVVSPTPARDQRRSGRSGERAALERAVTDAQRLLKRMGLAARRLDGEAVRSILVASGMSALATGDDGTHILERPLPDETQDAMRLPDGIWARSFYVLAPPEETDPGWLEALVSFNGPVHIALHAEGLDQQKERKRLKRRRRYLSDIAVSAAQRGHVGDVDDEGARLEADDLARALRASGKGIARVGLYVTVFAPDRGTLDERAADLRGALARGVDATPGDGIGHQGPLWESTLPLGRDAARSSYRMLSETAGNAWPCLRHSAGTATGLPLGVTATGDELVLLDLTDRSLRNRLIDVLGQSGRGKTFVVQKLVTWFLLCDAWVTVVDNAGGYGPLCALAGGATVRLGGPRTAALNIWDGPRAAEEEYAAKVEFVAAAHEMLLARPGRPLDDYEYAAISEGIAAVYAAHADGSPPLEREFVAWLERTAAETADVEDSRLIRRLAYRLRPYVGDGPFAPLVDRPTSVDLDARLLVCDLQDLKDGSPVRAFAMFAVTELANRRGTAARAASRAAGRSTLDHLLVIDEGWWMLKHGGAREWVNSLGRKGRRAGITPAFASQQLSDLTGDPAAAGYFNQASLHLIFGLEDNGERDGTNPRDWLASKLKLTPHEVEQIEHLAGEERKHAQMFLIRGTKSADKAARGIVNVLSSPEEYWLFASDPDDEELRARMVEACGGDVWVAIQALAAGTMPEEIAGRALARPEGGGGEPWAAR